MKSIKAIFRRGHKEGQGHQDNISRTSSVTNLDSLESNIQAQQGKTAKPRKAASKERIDKQVQDGKKAITKNNNKLEPPPPTGQPLSYSSESLHEVELQQLRKQLREMSDEKSSLALQLGEQRGQLTVLQKEIQKMKSFQEESNLEMDRLAEENTALRNRLRDVAHSPLSDNEKQQLLFESRHHNSAPASIATNVVDDNGGDATTCTTPDWDKHSSSNVSEVSVACLQDKINQMQETHYSTNEELQATLQELTDLQRQLTELQQENERLNEEKTLMFDSLCRQTERLNDSRQEVENLKQLLYRDRSDETGVNQLESAVEREQKLVELLRSAQEEREQLLLKLEQMQAELQDSRAEIIDKSGILGQQTERVKTLECTLDAKHAEHKQLDQELAQAKDHCSGKQIEINRLTDLLENARTKINELEQDRTLSDKSELDELLDNARKEKDQLESEVAYLKEQLARSKNEIEKLKEQVFVLQEECKVTRNNAKTTQSDLEYKCEKLVAEKNSLGEQLQQFQEAVNELQVQAQCHLEDKRQLSAVLSETQRNLSEAERRNLNLETEIQELKKLRAEENDEWEKFQNDLLTSVRVANDFKTEAQQELQKIILENKTYREKLRLLEGQVEKLKGEKTSSSTQTDIILTPHLISLAKNLDQSVPNRLSLIEHPVSTTSLGARSPTTPTSSMDKLFPILSKERRSKSRDNLSDDVYKSSETPLRRSKSKENLSSVDSSKRSSTKSKKIDKSKIKVEDEPKKEHKGFFKRSTSKDNLEDTSQPVEKTTKENKGFLRRNKSKDNLTDVGPSSSKKDEPGKGGIGFLKRNKSKDNLKQHEVDSETLKKDEDSTKKESAILDKPRKSKDSIDSSSSSSKSDFSKPEFFSKFIKKRDKKMLSHRKTMSVEEETLLKSLDSWYLNIDQNIPDELLSQEDRAVKKLKVLFEDDQLKEKPVAHKPKEQLAISKPLLNSVVQNPKLEEIVRDPRVQTVETQVRESALEDTFSIISDQQEHHTTTDGPRVRIRSEEVYTNIGPKSLGIHKCQSLDDLNVFEEYRTESELAPVLYRTVETDNLTREEHLEIKAAPRYDRLSSEIYPNDSVSNPRYSTKYHDVQLKEYVPNDLPKPNIYINYENLDEIIHKIPKDVPESKLTEEQRFALKLKLALDEAETKTTLNKIKKKKKPIRGLEISEPTPESVQKNWKLKEIMLNPRIKKTEEVKKDKFFSDLFDETDRKRHSIDISSDIGELEQVERRPGVIRTNSMSKSYEDISFSFVPENTLLGLYYGNKDRHNERPKITSDTSSSSRSFTSAEFNLDTGKIIQSWEIPTELDGKQVTAIQKDEEVKANEDLLYNETINKEKNKKKSRQQQVTDNVEYEESVEQLKQDLSLDKAKSSTDDKFSQNKVDQDPWLKDSLERYKKDLKQIVKRIDSDHLRESLRRRDFKASELEIQYQMAHAELIFNKHEVSFESPVEVYGESQHETEDAGPQNFDLQHVQYSEEQNGAHFIEDGDSAAVGDNTLDSRTVDEAINFSVASETIRDFIFNEQKFSGSYNNQQHNYTTEKTMDSREVIEQLDESNQEDAFRGEQSGIVDSVSRRSYDLSPGLDHLKSPPEEVNHLNKHTVSFYDMHFQSPVDVNAHFETSKITVINKTESASVIEESDTVKPEHVSFNADHMTIQSSNATEAQIKEVGLIVEKSHNDNKIISSEPELPFVVEQRSIEAQEPIIFQCPTGMTDVEPLGPEDSDNNCLPAFHEEINDFGIEAIHLEQSDIFKNQNFREYKNKFSKGSHIIIEDINYQLPAATWEAPKLKSSLEIKEITNDVDGEPNNAVLDKTLTDPIISHTSPFEISEYYPEEERVYSAHLVNVIAPQTTEINEHTSPLEMSEYYPQEETICSAHLVNVVAPQTAEVNEEYGYQEILKENQYGVVSPLDLRYTYRGVVKEYKKRYPPEPAGESDEVNAENSDASDIEYNEDFIDEFFKPPKGFEHGFSPEIGNVNYQGAKEIKTFDDKDVASEEVETRRREEAVSEIDKEMQNIMEKYLHTRTSLLVRTSGVDLENKEKSLELRSNLKKYDNFENLNEIDSGEPKINEEAKHLVEIKTANDFENKDVTGVEPEQVDFSQNIEGNEPLSQEDLKFIEEMKAKYVSTDTLSTISEKIPEPLPITEEEIKYKHQHLTDEELNLLRSSKSDRYSRPLSDINERDLLLVEEISRRYFRDGSLPSSVRSSLQQEGVVQKTSKGKYKEHTYDVGVTSEVSKIDIGEKEQEVIPPLPLSLPPEPATESVSFNVEKYADIAPSAHAPVLKSSESVHLPQEEVSRDNKSKTSKSEDTVDAFEHQVVATTDKSKENDIFHLPPSLRPRIPAAHQPIVSYQPHSNVIYRDKSKMSSAQESRMSTNGSPSNRLSDLIFKETIFVPVSKDDKMSASPKSPLSPGYKHIDEKNGGTWRNHEKPDFKQTIVVPAPRKIGYLNPQDSNELKSPSSKSPADHSFRETIFIPSAVEPKERPKSIIATTPSNPRETKKTSDLSFKETIIIPAKQRPASYSWENPVSKDSSEQLEIEVVAVNKPGYHSYKETIIVPKSHESPQAKDGNSKILSLQKSVTQSKNSSRSEVKVNFNRYSAIPKPRVTTTSIRASDRRPLSEPFKSRPLAGGLSNYEPVYSNLTFSTNTYKSVFSSEFKKKPLPVPRSTEPAFQSESNEYLAGTSPLFDDDNANIDSFENMTDSNENFSETLANKETGNLKTPNSGNFAQLQAKFSDGTALKEPKENNIVSPEHAIKEIAFSQEKNVPSDQLILVESKAETNILKNKLLVESVESAGSSRISEKSDLQNDTTESLGAQNMTDSFAKDDQSGTSGSSSTVKSAASIAVTTKGEQLDITKAKASADFVLEEDVEDVERKPSGVEPSDVNLFNMDSHSSYDSYLELFKSKESKDFDNLRGKKSPVKNYFGVAGFAYVEELAAEGVTSDDIRNEARPKIVDFVPLDDDTTPVFTKENRDNYDTLEREKTFHVLNQASKMSDKQSKEGENAAMREKVNTEVEAEHSNKEASLEILAKKSSSVSKASSKSQTDTSRTSFTQAKKIFEALVEANKDERPKTAGANRSPARYSVRDSRSVDQMRSRSSKEGEVASLGETGIMIKDGDQGPLDTDEHNKK